MLTGPALFSSPSLPQPLSKFASCHRSSVWGPTCDGLDKICDDSYLPELEVGDWLYFDNMGAYTISAYSPFNGFPKPASYYFVKECDRWVWAGWVGTGVWAG